MILSEERIRGLVDKIESHKEVEKVIMLCLAGSHAYGTSTPESDLDIRGVFVTTKGVIRAPFRVFREYEVPEEEDAKVYELNNFMALFTEMNPNVIELGFTKGDALLYSTPEWEYLSDNLERLLNTNVAHRFSGYAISQLKRIKGHSKWINNPQPKDKPTQKEFVRLVHSWSDLKILKHEHFMSVLESMKSYCLFVPYGNNVYGVVQHFDNPGLFNKDGSIRKIEYESLSDLDKKAVPFFIVKYLDNDHKAAKERHHNYWNWVKNRNPKRHVLEEKYGYDTKHAMHLVRLLRMGEEILEGKGVLVNRPDSSELLEIRDGKFQYDELVSWAEAKDLYIREDLYRKSKLPHKKNLKLAEDLILNTQDMVWGS